MTIRQPIITVAGHVDHGKCVAGDTIIPLVDGTMKKAQELYDENVDTIKLKKIDDGFLQDITDKNIRIFSFNGKNIEPANISHIWKRQAKRLIEVKTSSGDIIKTTPEHPFFVFSLEGIRTRKAEDLKENDYIALPKKLPFQSQNIKDKIISRLKNLDNFVCFLNEKFQQKFDKIKKFKDVEKKLNISHLRDSIAKKRLRIKDLFILAEHYKIPDEEAYDCIQSIKNSSTIWRGGHTSKKMQLPNLEENEKFGYLLGCIAGDGHLSKTRVILNNNDLEVQTAYRESLKEIFELESTTEQAHTCQIVVDKGGKTFLRFMTDVIGFPKKNKSATVEVPALAKKNKEVFRGFIAGLFDTDGYVSKLNNSIEITSKSENMLKQCATYLLSFGIHATLYKKNIYTVLRIANKIYLNRFLDNFRPRLKRKLKRIIDSSIKAQSSRIFDFIPLQGANLKQLEVKGKINKQVPYFNKYMHTSALSIAFLQAVVSNLKKDNEISRKLREILETDISYVKVTSKKAIDNEEKYVYDFTVPNNHNFVAERILVHNTSLLDCFRGSSVQAGEAGGITQKISFTKYPLEQIEKVCPLIKKNKVKLKIPGFLFIDTPGHAAFTNLRKRGGALADLAILVIDIKKGIEPQTAEVLSILKANKTPFVVALNKIDNLSGWKKRDSIKEAVETQALNVKEEFDTALLTFQGALQAHGFDSALYYELGDFTKKIAIVPCSAKTKEGIPELLFVLCGLCQKFLSKQLELAEDAKGVILEVKKERGMEYAEAILYDGDIAVNEEIMIASLDKPITTKIRTLEEIQPLAFKYKAVQHATAATGIRVQLTEREGLLPGMPFQEIKGNFDEIANSFKKEISGVTKLDKKGVIIKADSLGSLEALITLLRQANVLILKAGIGPISKSDISAAKANLDNEPLDALVIGFNVGAEEEIEYGKVAVFTDEVVYKLIEKVQEWRQNLLKEIEKEKLMGLATICKLEILPQFVFRNSNPAIFGVRIQAGTLKSRIPLIDENDNSIAHIKAIQADKHNVEEAQAGQEIAISLPGVTFDRQLKVTQYLYANLSESQFKAFKKHKELLSADELRVLQEIQTIKQRKNSKWGVA